MDRPIVVNSLLCFIHNYRDSLLPHQLKSLVNNYFSKSAISVAHATLLELLPPHLSSNPPSDIIFLFDRINKSEQSPVFAAADLNILPLTLITDDDDSKNELLREIRQLKRFIQDALNGKLDEPTLHSTSRTPPADDQSFSTPKPMCKMNVSASSPESPSSTAAFGATCSAVTPSPQNTHPLSSAPYARPNHTVSNHLSSRRRNEGSGNRLDAMVRKLTDKQKEKEALELTSAPVWPSQIVDPLAYINMLRTMTSNVTSQSSIFPAVTKISDTPICHKNDSCVENDEKMEDINNEMEKNSDDSSPSPSDSSNNVDEFSYNSNDLAEKPFTCEHTNCHKRFANKFLLKKHQFIHTGLRPHCCPFCGKRFNRKDNLLRHKKTHLANALGPEVTSALSSDDFLLQLGAEKPIIKLENEQEEEEEL